MRARLLLLLGACAVLMGAAAHNEVNGPWSFKTEPFDGGCVMTGQLTVSPAPANQPHACTLIAHEKCPSLEADALESCTLDVKSGAVSITSKIVKAPPLPYDVDNFQLKLESASRMSGRLVSAGGGGPVVFFRGPALVS